MSGTKNTVAVARQSSYLKAGNKLNGNESREEFLKKTGMNFTVEAREVRDVVSGLTVPGVRCVARLNDGLGFGVPFRNTVVGTKMKLFQNEQAFAPLMDVVDRGLGTYEAGGTFHGGAVTWALVDLGKSVEIHRRNGSSDQINLKLFARNAHDGSSNLIWGAMPVSFFCTNQINGIAKGLKLEVRIPHLASGVSRVDELSGYLSDIVAAFHESATVWQILANQRMTSEEFRVFAREFLLEIYGAVKVDPKDEEKTARRFAKREELVDELDRYFREGKGNSGESVWDGYQGTTEWIEHRNEEYRYAKWTAAQWQNHAASQAFGTARDRKTKALRMLTHR